jgi:hypothetical protein
MPTPTEPTRLQLELREDTWIAPGRTAIAWRTAMATVARPVPSAAVAAECVCPTDCIRDHETD